MRRGLQFGCQRGFHSLGICFAAVLLVLLCALEAFALWRAPAAWFPAAIAVNLGRGESLRLGQTELGAPQADHAHIALRRDADGAWWLQNISRGKQVLLQSAKGEQRVRSHVLQTSEQFRIGGHLFAVKQADAGEGAGAGQVVFSDQQQEWRYDGALLYRNGKMQAPCPDASLNSRAIALLNHWLPSALQVARPMQFGGNLYCDNRLGLTAVGLGAASLVKLNRAITLMPASADREHVSVSGDVERAIGGTQFDLRRQEQPLAGVSGIVLGHTQFHVTYEADSTDPGGRMLLHPDRRVALFAAPVIVLPPQLQWRWQQRDPWQLILPSRAQAGLALWVGVILMVMVLAASALALQYGYWPFRVGSRRQAYPTALVAVAALSICALGLIALCLPRLGGALGVAYSMLLGWLGLWLWMLLPGRRNVAAALGIVLLAVGMLAQLEQGLGGAESFWLRYFQKTSALTAFALGAGALLRLWLESGANVGAARLRLPPQRSIEAALAALALCALAAQLLQVLFGDEAGVFDIQPVEFAKTTLVLLTAHVLALRIEWQRAPAHTPTAVRYALWLRLAWPALLLLALSALALVSLSDYSPLVLLMVWGMVSALSYATAARNLPSLGVLTGIGLVALVLFVVIRSGGIGGNLGGDIGANAAMLPDSPLSFYADRFSVWLNPALHPHTGQQFLLGAQAIADGGWWGADHVLGLWSLGQPAGALLQIPAVQDDFAAAFFMNRHGLIGALMLWCLQAFFIMCLLHHGWRLYTHYAHAGDFRQAWFGRFSCFVLCGGAGFVMAQVLLSWGTNVAIFPVMGQPMSFLSAGGSHWLFFLFPLLCFDAITTATLQEF